jgi:hypothetical protein
LDADEVAAAYNGESTPFKYADAGDHTELVTNGEFTADNGTDPVGNITGWGSYGTAPTREIQSNTFKITVSAINSGAVWTTTSLVIGKTYRVSCTATGSLAADSMYASGAGTVGASFSTLTGTASHDFTCTESGTFYVYFRPGTPSSTSERTTYFDNFSVTEVGEVVAYTPQSINEYDGKWYDETSNANHGTIVGATTVGNPRHYGTFHVKGKTTAGIVLENTTASSDIDINYANEAGDIQSRIRYDEGNGKFQFYSNSGQTPRLEIGYGDANGGSVTATSATSTNLKQVARVHSQNITFNSTTTAIAFRVLHNLGTKYVTVSVCENANSGGQLAAHVETEVRLGDCVGADIGAVTTQQSSTDTNYVTIIFSGHQGDATAFKVTVIG